MDKIYVTSVSWIVCDKISHWETVALLEVDSRGRKKFLEEEEAASIKYKHTLATINLAYDRKLSYEGYAFFYNTQWSSPSLYSLPNQIAN
jgi:hypothetical protein